METSIIVISPCWIYCKRTNSKCSVLQPMSTWLIYPIFVKIWFAHICDNKSYAIKVFVFVLILFSARCLIWIEIWNNLKLYTLYKVYIFFPLFCIQNQQLLLKFWGYFLNIIYVFSAKSRAIQLFTLNYLYL